MLDVTQLANNLTRLFNDTFNRLTTLEQGGGIASSSSASYVDGDKFAADTSSFKDFHTMFLPTDAAATVTIPAPTDSGMLLAWRNKFPIGGTMRFMISHTGYVSGTFPYPSLTVAVPAGDTLLIPHEHIARIQGSNKEFTLTRLSETVWKIGGDLDLEDQR